MTTNENEMTEPQTCDCGTVFDAADETAGRCPENGAMCEDCFRACRCGSCRHWE